MQRRYVQELGIEAGRMYLYAKRNFADARTQVQPTLNVRL